MLLTLLFCLLQTSPSDQLSLALEQYNRANAAAVEKLLLGFDEAEKQIKETQDRSATIAVKDSVLNAAKKDREKFLETGRLPEVSIHILARLQYHQTMFAEQQKLLAAYEETLKEARQKNPDTTSELLKRRDQLKQSMPSSEQVTNNSVWKGYRYNVVLRRFLYEVTITSVQGKKITGVMKKQNKTECEIEGTLQGPMVEFRITKVISGQKGSEVSFQGMVLGNRMLLKLEADTVFPMILYLQ